MIIKDSNNTIDLSNYSNGIYTITINSINHKIIKH